MLIEFVGQEGVGARGLEVCLVEAESHVTIAGEPVEGRFSAIGVLRQARRLWFNLNGADRREKLRVEPSPDRLRPRLARSGRGLRPQAISLRFRPPPLAR